MGTVNIRKFPDHLHEALRVEAAKRKSSIKAVVVEAVQEWLKREAGKGKGKA